MIVKFFRKPAKGGSGKASIDYLLDEKKHKGGKIELLQGDPELSKQISQNLTFANNYTVGCLSFEEHNLTDNAKADIMARFEDCIFAGLDKEQYNITWIQHTDKGRLELNFFVPNVELTSNKRLQPYYDKSDRPLIENFKQVINHEYGLTDPNAPGKRQTLITRPDLPKNKKAALEAINEGIKALYSTGKINCREDVISALENAGFEIARVTPKNISIKTESQNLRLKGAFYDEAFRDGESLRTDIETRSADYDRERESRYQTARRKLDSAVERRKREFRKRYPNRTSEIDKTYGEAVAVAELSNGRFDIASVNSTGLIDVAEQTKLSRDGQMEEGSKELSSNQPRTGNNSVQNIRQTESVLHQNRSKPQGEILGQSGQPSNITSQSGEVTDDGKRKNIRERIENISRKTRERSAEFSKRIGRIESRKRLNQDDVQRNSETKRANQQAINNIAKITQTLIRQSSSSRNHKLGRNNNQDFFR